MFSEKPQKSQRLLPFECKVFFFQPMTCEMLDCKRASTLSTKAGQRGVARFAAGTCPVQMHTMLRHHVTNAVDKANSSHILVHCFQISRLLSCGACRRPNLELALKYQREIQLQPHKFEDEGICGGAAARLTVYYESNLL